MRVRLPRVSQVCLIFKKTMHMNNEFEYRGHLYKVTPIEGNNEEFIIVKDGKQTRRISRDFADAPMMYIEKLFKQD